MKILLPALALALVGATANAQGSLSTQGFGYPPGQASTRAESMGGSSSELDPYSATNPASISDISNSSLYLQYEPEFRTVTTSSATSRTTTARFPVFGLIMPVGSRLNFSFGSATLVDRSSETRATRTRIVGSSSGSLDTLNVTDRVRTLGAIDDLRLAFGFAASPVLRIGVGAHLITGTNQITSTETFPDSAKFTNVSATSRLSYTGVAVSAGVEIHPSKVLALGLSARKGGNLRAESGDTVLANAKVPDRFAASLEYSGWGDASIAVHAARDSWSAMKPLVSSSVSTYDAWDIGAGAEAAGPRFLSHPTLVRIGVRQRTLPFSTTGSSIKELSFGGGFGIELAPRRANLDLGLQRANRTGSAGITEHAYILSFGLRVVP
jgi:opacity protein-like surface antigen